MFFLSARSSYARNRQGFTLIELLVVVAIIGVLIALLLPTIQAARESARRVGCWSNLRSIGIALHTYHDAHKTFPPGGIEWRGGNDLSQRQLGWCVFLLPNLEQVSVSPGIDFSQAFDAPTNALAAATILPVFICPSVPREEYLVESRGPTDYGGIYGERITSPNDPPKGTMLYDESIRLADIVDGASQTLIISEDALWPDGQWINGRSVFDQAFAINAAPPFENDIRSLHPGGANVLQVDGSTRFLSETLDLNVLAAICTRDGGEAVSLQ